MRLSIVLEVVAAVAFTVAAWIAFGAPEALAVAGASLLYLAQRRHQALWLTHLHALRLRPGTVLVARLPSDLPSSEFQAAEHRIRQEFAPARVVVIPDRVEIGAVRDVDATA